MGLYDAEIAFEWIKRNIRSFGGDPDNITIGGGSSGAGMTSVLTSLASVGPHIKGLIQISGDGFAPTTGFVPPPSWVRLNIPNIICYICYAFKFVKYFFRMVTTYSTWTRLPKKQIVRCQARSKC